MTQRFHARLHAVLASRTPYAVVFRRGPANAVCTVGWDRETDQFKVGQWLRGRIYERRSDISPDGRYLIYFARGGRRHAETGGSWTAVSIAPWLHAVTLYGKGDCWQGGGLFTSGNKYWLNGCHFVLREDRGLTVDTTYTPKGSFGAECPSVYYRRLLRDGWTLEFQSDRYCTVFTKPLPEGWVLRKFALADTNPPQGASVYRDEHEIEHAASGLLVSKPQWEWAELDGSTLVWAERGVLWRADLDSQGITEPRSLFDFNGLTFEAREAPYS